MRRRASRKPYQASRGPRLMTMLSALMCLIVAIMTLRSFQLRPAANADRPVAPQPGADEPATIPGFAAFAGKMDDDDSANSTLPSGSPGASSEQETGASENPVIANSDSADKETVPPEAIAERAVPLKNLSVDAELKDQLGVVRDNELKTVPTEMPSYFRFLKEANTFTHEELYAEADKTRKFNDLYTRSSMHRGELIGLDVSIWRVNRYDINVENGAGLDHVYEVWGVTKESKAWMYVFLVPEIPDWVEANIHHRPQVRFAGYYYKLQGYYSGKAAPGSNKLVAPLLIGRFDPKMPSTLFNRNVSDGSEMQILAILVIGAGIFLAAFIGYHYWRLQGRRRKAAFASNLKVVGAPDQAE